MPNVTHLPAKFHAGHEREMVASEMERIYLNQIARLQNELAEARAGQANPAARIDVLSATSHEMRTPLNAILGFSEILKKEMFGPLGHERYVEYARIINDSGSHLLGLINDLLDMSKLNAGKLRLHVEDVEIFRVIIDCVRQVEIQAAKSNIGITVQVFDGVKDIAGDDQRLHQMLLNLLSNAVKFTPEKGEVAVEVFRRSDFIGISVSDTGIGM
ncbi:MAG TPA: HAMP domain-containing sensor histidine kinase, partial [Rhizomicrobium sp.]